MILMDRLPTRIDKSSEDYSSRESHNSALIEELRQRVDTARNGGGAKYVERHEARGKRMPRDRISEICDPGSPFIELSTLAAFEMYDGKAHSAGIVTGIGLVHGKECVFVANDATVKGGSYYPMTVKKHIRAQEVAEDNNLPCIYLVDSGGAFLPLQDQVFPDKGHFGRIFRNQAILSSKGIPQVAAVLGSCTAGGAYIPAFCDVVFMTKKNAAMYLGSPRMAEMVIGEKVSLEEMGGAKMHTSESGCADFLCNTEGEALRRDGRSFTASSGPFLSGTILCRGRIDRWRHG